VPPEHVLSGQAYTDTGLRSVAKFTKASRIVELWTGGAMMHDMVRGEEMYVNRILAFTQPLRAREVCPAVETARHAPKASRDAGSLNGSALYPGAHEQFERAEAPGGAREFGGQGTQSSCCECRAVLLSTAWIKSEAASSISDGLYALPRHRTQATEMNCHRILQPDISTDESERKLIITTLLTTFAMSADPRTLKRSIVPE
jgi:hypothetical protein